MPKKGQTQPYKVFTTFPPSERLSEGLQMLEAHSTATAADRAARQRAEYGGTGEVLYYHADKGVYVLMFVYTPANVHLPQLEMPGDIYKDLDVLSWYQGMGFNPQHLDKKPAKGRTPAQPVGLPDTEQTDDNEPEETSDVPQQDAPAADERTIELNFDVENFPPVEAPFFRPVIAETMEIALWQRKDGTRYIGRVQLRGAVAKKDGTAGNAAGSLWFNPELDRAQMPPWLFDLATEKAASYLTAEPAPAADDMTDEELWNSPLGHRLRRYADKLLAAQEARIELFARRKSDHAVMGGVSYSRNVISPDGTTDERAGNDPWATYRSPELEGLREVIRETDGTTATTDEAAKAYIASLQGDERPTVTETPMAAPTAEVQYAIEGEPGASKPQDISTDRDETMAYAQRLRDRHMIDARVVYRTVSEWQPVTDEYPAEEHDMPVGPPLSGDEEAPADEGKPRPGRAVFVPDQDRPDREITCSLRDGVLHVNGDAGLIIKPRSTNVLTIELES
ncbi:DUF7239 family protein [Streptomyces griseoaurantiacus]|uniref:DUF7239 family protein n=1 Tax=Streptomyces griseoaurantiacus TaxID=68213 RepID=UPI003698BD1F